MSIREMQAQRSAGPVASTAAPHRASICIPTRDRADLLALTLESLTRQSVPLDRFEVIVAVDGSQDGTVGLLQRLRPGFALRWTRLNGRGSGAARNAAARLADHEVLIFLDDDQIASDGLVAAHLTVHERNPRVIAQGEYPPAVGWGRTGASLVFERSRRASQEEQRSQPIPFRLWGANFSLRRELWSQAGGFDEQLPRNQDLEFGLRVADLGVRMIVEPRAFSYHLHAVSGAGFRRQCFDQGRCMVRIARKRDLSLHSLVGGPVDRPADRLMRCLWVRSPFVARLLGQCLGAGLWTADRLGLPAAMLFASRAVRRFHQLGGIATELALPASTVVAEAITA